MQVSERNLISLRAALGKSTLAGSAAGRAASSRVHAALMPLDSPYVLDFQGVELITASAFREAILSAVQWAAKNGKPCFLANVNDVCRDEAVIASSQLGVVLLFARMLDMQLYDVRAVGALDEKLAKTLTLILDLGEADAKAVSEASGESTVTTVWNNRLVSLAKIGLLAERKVGKTKLYSAVARGMSYGK